MWRNLALILLSLFTSFSAADEVRNIAIVQSMIDAINDRRLDELHRFVATDVVRHSAATPGVVVTSLDEFRDFLVADIASMPDSTQTIEHIFGSGDFVAVRMTLEATQTGQMAPFPPTGKRMRIPFLGILRAEDHRIAEIWVEWDNLNALSQLGHLPPPGEAAEE